MDYAWIQPNICEYPWISMDYSWMISEIGEQERGSEGGHTSDISNVGRVVLQFTLRSCVSAGCAALRAGLVEGNGN